MRVLIFIDYWNFQLNWNDRNGTARCDWMKVGPEILAHVQGMITPMGLGQAQLEGVRLYASSLKNDAASARMLKWMNQTLQRIPGWSVFVRERELRTKPWHCRECGEESKECPSCHKPMRHAPEKGVDAAIISDMLTLAWEGAFDLAVLVSQDADFVPGVNSLQKKGIKVINAGWLGGGNQLQQECWASFPLENLASKLTRG